MTFEDLVKMGTDMPVDFRDGELFHVVHAPSFPALLGVLEEMKFAVISEMCVAEIHVTPGVLARASGQLSALEELKARLRAVWAGPPVKE